MGIKDLDSVVMNQAVEALVPFAIDKVGVIPAFPPQPEPKTALKRGQTFQFGLHLTPKPDYELTSYEPVSITIQEVSIDERQVDEQINQVAERYAEFVADDPHPVRKGDSCLLAMESYQNGEKLPGLTTDARTYSAGAGLMPDGFDENIIGMDVGETKTFTFDGPRHRRRGQRDRRDHRVHRHGQGDPEEGRPRHRRRLGGEVHAHVQGRGRHARRHPPRPEPPSCRASTRTTSATWPPASWRSASRAASPTRCTSPCPATS